MSRLLAGAAVVSVSALTGCTPAGGEHLDLGATAGTICVPEGASGPKTFGAMNLHNVSPDPVRLSRVELVDARDLTVIGARLVPSTGSSQLVGAGWPPVGLATEFAASLPLPGHVLEPGDQVTLWAGVMAEDGSGRAAAIRVHYAVDGRPFHRDGVDALRVVAAPSC